tara:strand:+ start:938 stop:1747 length:810 start_codon:yes stop_codon:yes gene_type:complete
MENFDYDFYTNYYPDLKNMKKKEALHHYLTSGKKEKRLCNIDMLLEFQNKTNKKIKEEYENLDINKISLPDEKMFNILIRTSNRPENFKQCVKSVLDQKYKNFKIYVCYDKKESIDYLNNYKNTGKIKYFPVYTTSKEKYKFNLYCNDLLSKVKEGYVIFLDDDDIFCHDQVFNILNYCINNNSLLIWKFFRPDKIIFPSDLKTIDLGEIDTTCFCSNIKNYKNCNWHDKKNGDYNFITKVIEKNKPKIKFLNKILTKTQFTRKICNSN